jgi:hypothetical protein
MGEENSKNMWTVVEHVVSGVRSIQELREVCKYLDIVADVTMKRWKYIGHVANMDQGRTVKNI